jgi:phosphatidylglycerophosphatase A
MDLNIFLNISLGQNKLTPKQVLTDPVLFLAFGFGSGLAKKAPGTMGTISAIPVYLLLVQTTSVVYILATLVSCILGIWICGITADRLGEHDFSGIVWDEIAGLLVTMSFVPFSWEAVAYGFVLFRLFDIIKPWPISWIDKKVAGGLGIMLDDIAAGIVAGGILWWMQ